jgi:hypothetical protein
MEKAGCLICGCDLEYQQNEEELRCSVCDQAFSSNAQCTEGHYVCDVCHQTEGMDYIERYCLNSREKDPMKLAIEIMGNPSVKMHGPEHHFLVPGVLLTTYHNVCERREDLPDRLATARKRGGTVPGGHCGFFGNCGAAVGTGIFISIIQDCTPLSTQEWRLSNLMTSKSLERVANNGGPRCCKRNTYLAIESAVEFLAENFDTTMEISHPKCGFSHLNKECKTNECLYF